jgi:aspartate ammonia-lyase
MTRRETDLLGALEVPADALWGIHTQRALENFPLAKRPVHRGLVHAFGAVKLACLRTNRELGWGDERRFTAIQSACEEMIAGTLDNSVVVDALQGGAGTSTNMNVNEVLANRALQIMGCPLADYAKVNPHNDINLHQSTNDTYPTALKIAAIHGLRELQSRVVSLMEAFQEKEKLFADVVKIGRTELQDAVLMTLGHEMSAYAEAFSRDRWRIYKCEERLREVNLGGTAIGTTLGAPRQYVFRVVENLRKVTGLGLARAENLVEATQNADVFIEVSGILRTLAGSLLKCANDLRLLGSGPNAGLGEIRLPPRQAGSSIMPGKVNPVIPEAVGQVAMAVFGYDQMIVMASSAGNLELNQYLPLVADSLLTMIDLLSHACDVFVRNCILGIEADREQCLVHVGNSTATLTALVERIGYDAAEQAAEHLHQTKGDTTKTLRSFVVEKGWLSGEDFDQLTSPERVTRLGSPNGQGTTS